MSMKISVIYAQVIGFVVGILFCEWNSRDNVLPKASVEGSLRDLLHDYLGLLLEENSNEEEKKEMNRLVKIYAGSIKAGSCIGGETPS